MASDDAIIFTRAASDRIAAAVLKVEAGDRNPGGLLFERVFEDGTKVSRLRVGSFTADWQTGQWQVVTLTNSTHTVNVYNWTTPSTNWPAGSDTAKVVVFGVASNTASVIEIAQPTPTCVMQLGNINLANLPGYDAGEIQLLGHNAVGPCLQWYSVTTCTTAS